jgi:peptide/nickel transport system ATP-binding protein
MTSPADVAVRVRGLNVRFVSQERKLFSANGVFFDLRQGEVLGTLGESGSGKSVTLKAMMRLLPPAAQITGAIEIDGTDVVAMPESGLERLRGRHVSMIFRSR